MVCILWHCIQQCRAAINFIKWWVSQMISRLLVKYISDWVSDIYLHDIHYTMHSCLAETKRINFMNALKTRRGRPHLVHRSAIFDSVTTLYKSSLGSILEEYISFPHKVQQRTGSRHWWCGSGYVFCLFWWGLQEDVWWCIVVGPSSPSPHWYLHLATTGNNHIPRLPCVWHTSHTNCFSLSQLCSAKSWWPTSTRNTDWDFHRQP